ncbi:MAG: hypothetical protein IKJ63_07635 [Clostridia bacterium]|nr:hypothetical protein [Clostridia bacterium]
MRSLMLFVCCCSPCALAMQQFVKTYKTIELLKNLQLVFEQITFVLSGSVPDAVNLFRVLRCRNVFPVFCTNICDSLLTGATFAESWMCGLCNIGGDMLSVSEKEEILSFADSFGLGSVDEQIRICKHFSQFCINAIDKRKNNLAKNGKLYLSGSLLFGALIFVLLF